MDGKAFWTESGLEHIVPEGFGDFPEGFDVKGELKQLVDDIGYRSLLDFGCGYGRLCESFEPGKYLGVDINGRAIAEAKKRYAGYRFEHWQSEPITADVCLSYSVFFHMTDAEIHQALKKMWCKWVIVAELLGKEWRRDGMPPIYSREENDYIQLFRCHDLVMHKHIQRPYKRYADTPWYQNKNTNLSFMVFKKCLKNPLL